MAREWRSTVAVALAAALTLMSVVGIERASAEGIASGTTRLELNRGLFKALKKEDVRITKVGLGSVTPKPGSWRQRPQSDRPAGPRAALP